SSDTALRLARYFGTSERFWLGMQVEYDLEEARNALADRLEREVKPIAPPLDIRSKNPAVSREIRQMVNRIVRRFYPERIILFGSHARGDAGPDSDVDLLIVLPFSGSRHEKQVEIRLALRGIRIPTDIVVTTPEDFLWRKEVPGTIERPAAREGKLLYVRP